MGCKKNQCNESNSLCYGELKEIHDLVKDFLENNENVVDDLDCVLCSFKEVLCSLKEAVEDQEDTIKAYNKIQKWIRKNADCYDCNANSCEFKELSEKIEKILCEIQKNLLDAVKGIHYAYNQIKDAQCLEEKLDKVFEKYSLFISRQELRNGAGDTRQ